MAAGRRACWKGRSAERKECLGDDLGRGTPGRARADSWRRDRVTVRGLWCEQVKADPRAVVRQRTLDDDDPSSPSPRLPEPPRSPARSPPMGVFTTTVICATSFLLGASRADAALAGQRRGAVARASALPGLPPASKLPKTDTTSTPSSLSSRRHDLRPLDRCASLVLPSGPSPRPRPADAMAALRVSSNSADHDVLYISPPTPLAFLTSLSYYSSFVSAPRHVFFAWCLAGLTALGSLVGRVAMGAFGWGGRGGHGEWLFDGGSLCALPASLLVLSACLPWSRSSLILLQT